MSLGARLIVANTGESSLSVIDPFTRKEVRRIMLLPGVGPYDLVECCCHGCILVTQYYDGTVALVEVSTGEILESISLGRCPSYLVYDRKRNYAFISNCDSNSISILAVPEMKLLSQISVGSMPQGMDLDPLRDILVVANVDSKDLWFIDSRNFSIVKVVKLKYNPFHVRYSRSGCYLFISCLADEDGDRGTIVALDRSTLKVIYTITINGMPGRLYNTQDGRHLLVTSLGKGGIKVFEARGGKFVGDIITNGMTHGIVSDLEEKYIYVTNVDDNSVSIVDLGLGVKVGDIKTGKEPNGIIMLS